MSENLLLTSSPSGSGEWNKPGQGEDGARTSLDLQISEQETGQSIILPSRYGTRSKGNSSLLSKEELMSSEPAVGYKKKPIDPAAPPTQLWSTYIPSEANLRHHKFRAISSTMFWPMISTMEAESKMFRHFIDEAVKIGGATRLSTNWIINSQDGAMYQCIVRFNDDHHRKTSLSMEKSNILVFDYLAKFNCCISTAVIDLKYYMGRHKLPITVLIGEGESNIRYPHCTSLIFRFYNNKWEVINKDCTNNDNMDVRPITRKFLREMCIASAYFVPLSELESNRNRINCLGQALQASASVLDGRMTELWSGSANTMIWTYDVEDNDFKDNDLGGIPWVQKHLWIPDEVKLIDTAESRAKLVGFRTRVARAGQNIVPETPRQVRTPNIEYAVESVVGRKRVKQRLEYKIKWIGYGPEHDSWQDTSCLDGCKDLVLEYDRQLEHQIEKGLRGHRKTGNRLKLEHIMPTWFPKRKRKTLKRKRED